MHAAIDRCDAHTNTVHAHCDSVGDDVSEADRFRADHDAAADWQGHLEEWQGVGGLHQMLSARQAGSAPAASSVSGASVE